jgi:hypothetical protein
MSVSIVKLFVCTSGCDVAKAKQGHDPKALPGAPPSHRPNASGLDAQPATILDGALKKFAAADHGAVSDGGTQLRRLDKLV